MPMYRSPHQLVRLAHQLTLKAVTGSMGRMAEMLAAQKQQRELEALRDRKRRELFARQDGIQGRRDGLIDAVLFLGVWDQLNNAFLNSLEFEGIKNEAGRNSFFLSAKKWIEVTGAIGLHAKAGRYGGTSSALGWSFQRQASPGMPGNMRDAAMLEQLVVLSNLESINAMLIHQDAAPADRLPSGRVVVPPSGNYWRFSIANFEQARSEGRVYFGANGDGLPIIKRYITEVQDGVVPRTWWPAEEAGSNQSAKRDHLRKLLPEIEPFATPKPEELLRLALQISTNAGDLVLDSFAGSGTTGAVAHKMGRRWIMVELGEHCHTHIIPRLKKVIDGEDLGGVTEATGWKGGGGFRYYRLAGSLLQQDRWGQWIVNKDYNAEMLAAICKLEGFTYAPSSDLYWQHGHSTESDFIYVTTQSLNVAQLQALSDEVGPDRTLLVCCGAFRADANRFPNLTVKKIPKMVLQKCEWGHDDYSLNVENLPQAQPSPPAPLPKGEGSMVPQGSLFDGGEG